MATQSFSGTEFTYAQRQRAVRELDLYRRQGVLVASQVLSILTPENLEKNWPYVAEILNRLMLAQQSAGNSAVSVYLGAAAIGLGIAPNVSVGPTPGSLARVGLLPSGMPWSRLLASTPSAVGHRVENGLTAHEALTFSKRQLVVAVDELAHDAARKAVTDILKAADAEPDWTRLDAEFDSKQAQLREDAYLAEQRRLRRNKSSRQKQQMWGDSPGNPKMTRYIRVPSAGACTFCLMLATRGAVYYKDSWSDFRKDGTAKAHAHCHCTLFPEPAPGEWKNKIFGDPKQYESAIWRDTRTGRQYELSGFTKAKDLLSAGDLERLRYVLAA